MGNKNISEYKNHIFDVGAFNGIDGLALAVNNPNFFIHAFEANSELIEFIWENKKKIEKFKGINILNYKINNLAVSNIDDNVYFNIAKNPTVSSLNEFSNNLDQSWIKYKDQHFKYIKKIKIKVITLEKYCIENNINNISYLHIDTQGNDLKVLEGLKSKIDILEQGILEAAVDKKKSLYKKNHTVDDVKKFLNEKKFNIYKIENIDQNIVNEKNIYFYNAKLKKNSKKIFLNYNLRYFNRIITNRTTIKDVIFDLAKKLFKIK